MCVCRGAGGLSGLSSSSGVLCAGGSPQSEEEEEAAALSRGSGVCKWFNMRMGFGFISMSSRDGAPLDPSLDVFVHQVRGTSEVPGRASWGLRGEPSAA